MSSQRSAELDDLAERLLRVFGRRPVEGTRWREPIAMPAALKRVRAAFGERLIERTGPRTNRRLLAFRLAPDTVDYVGLKLICRAVARPADWEQRRLIDDDELMQALLRRIAALPLRRRQACVRGLRAALVELAEGEGRLPRQAIQLQQRIEEMSR